MQMFTSKRGNSLNREKKKRSGRIEPFPGPIQYQITKKQPLMKQ